MFRNSVLKSQTFQKSQRLGISAFWLQNEMDYWVLTGKSSVVAVWFMNSKLFLSKQGVPIGARESIQTNIFVVTRFQREALSWCFSMNDSILFFLIYKGRSWLVWIVFATYILENQISNLLFGWITFLPRVFNSLPDLLASDEKDSIPMLTKWMFVHCSALLPNSCPCYVVLPMQCLVGKEKHSWTTKVLTERLCHW